MIEREQLDFDNTGVVEETSFWAGQCSIFDYWTHKARRCLEMDNLEWMSTGCKTRPNTWLEVHLAEMSSYCTMRITDPFEAHRTDNHPKTIKT